MQDLPNVEALLRPAKAHPTQQLWRGLLVEVRHIDSHGQGWVCCECRQSLKKKCLPKYSLNNDLWIGDPPLVLRKLSFAEMLLIARHYPRCYVFKLYPKDSIRGFNPAHLQRGMAGNVSLYEVNTEAVAGMVEGNLLPQRPEVLSNVLAITFIGTRRLPNNWLSRTFQVRCAAVHEALQWLKANNPLYSDIAISSDQLVTLPEEGIPAEVMALIRHKDNESAAVQEREGYVDSDGTGENGKCQYSWKGH